MLESLHLHIKSFTPTNILSGYEATGIHPYNPEKVKSHITKQQSIVNNKPIERIPLSEILTIPGQNNTPPSSPAKKIRRPGMPFTRILTSNQMHEYFINQAASEQSKQEQKQINKRKRIEKTKQKLNNKSNTNKNKKKKRVKKENQSNDSNKENQLIDISDIDEADDINDDTYNATIASSILPSTNRPRRLAAESAHIKINLADYSWQSVHFLLLFIALCHIKDTLIV